MSFGNTFENDLLKLILVGTAIADIAENDTTGPLTNYYLALHTADPGEAGDQTTSECAYTGYIRKVVARTAGAWTITTNSFTNAADLEFAACTAAPETALFWSLGVASSGASKILFYGALSALLLGPFLGETDDDLISIKGHGLTTDDRVVFFPTPESALPTGITEGTVYFVLATGLVTDAFKVSTTSAGATANITVDGDGVAVKVSPRFIDAGITPRFVAGAIVGYLD